MSDIEIRTDGRVRELRLNRPAKKNALTLAMYRELAAALADADRDDGVRVALVTGAGDTFCAGNDIGDFIQLASGGGMDPETAPPMQFLRALVGFGKPIVGAARGAAVGIGLTMLLHVDIVHIASGTQLVAPFVNLGLTPEAASSLLLPARLGPALAAEALLFGEPIDAAVALAHGLVNGVHAPGELDDLARRRAAELAAKAPNALRATRALLHRDRAAVLARMDEEAELFAASLASAEAREGFAAFVQKRPAKF